MIEIVIPMAGEGKRFAAAGYALPKAFVDVCGAPMLKRVIDSVVPSVKKCGVTVLTANSCRDWLPADVGEFVVGATSGAVDTIHRFRSLPWVNWPTMISNCDLWLAKGVIDDFLAYAEGPDCSLITFPSTNPHHSYVRLNDECLVTEIKEKQVISDEAVAGVYWFRSGALLEDYCRQVVESGDRFNGEFYLSSVIAAMVADGLSVTTFPVEWDQVAMLGTPEELAVFEQKVAEGRITL